MSTGTVWPQGLLIVLDFLEQAKWVNTYLRDNTDSVSAENLWTCMLETNK